MKKLLLTGFEPFLQFPINPTMSIVEALHGEVVGDFQINGHILPVDFNKAGTTIKELVQEEKPDAIIALGLAGGRYKINPERIAINCNDGEADNEGHTPAGEKIISDGPDGLFSTLPIQQIVSQLQQSGYPAEISNTAGVYLCNHVMYQVLYALQDTTVPAGFIHIPASHELAIEHQRIPSWSQADLTESIRIAIQCL
ncbi:pyroglutamyl-peptidase I [Pontibacillus yanchengensis]|uniref:Pyrrolidone-carboxylate peptidase n=1 Tax=Pontibacillus yanchengensis TaxID=462910 RepID=A0A6I5A105_9BACI|nr:pyroglutamyl-peptidase I [Pontibacillus yanchengensis]MYL33942.1 pyroglutamyl-peptidase I [Pontibacillus yanchengensis]